MSEHDQIDLTALERATEMPAAFRTGHWYNDLQHFMCVILFRRLMAAANGESRRLKESLIDASTVYLYIHLLDEEEGFAFAASHGVADRAEVVEHTRIHLALLDLWRDHVLFPFKAGELDGGRLCNVAGDFYRRLLAHIDGFDQHEYGVRSERGEFHFSEIAHLSCSGLPLSPFMPGAIDVVRALAPDVARTLVVRNMGALAAAPLPGLVLAPSGDISDQGRGLRDRAARLPAARLPAALAPMTFAHAA